MITRTFALAFLGLFVACSSDTVLEDKPNAKTLDDSTTRWDDGPAPMPDPPLSGDGADADGDPTGDGDEQLLDAGTDAGSASDAGQDAAAGDGG